MATIIAGASSAKKPWLQTGIGGIVGGLLGLLAGPMVAAGGAMVGGAGGWFYGSKIGSKLSHLIPPSLMQSLAIGGGDLLHPTLAAQVADSGLAKSAATALYAYLKVHGPDGSNNLAALVSDFQSQSNSDPNAVKLTGPLPMTATYDAKTAGALTLYTHDPIAAATPPQPQPPPTQAVIMNPMIPGAAATSGFNLYTYLKANGNKKGDVNLQRLVQQFQIDVNTDPKFPGPAPSAVPPIIIHGLLSTSGTYDKATAAALTVMSTDPISP